MAIITLRQVSLSFGLAPLLDHINLTLEIGERVALVGRNGAGKSTLLKLLAKEINADGGEISGDDGLVLAKLVQEVPDNIEGIVYDVVAEGLGTPGKLWAKYQHLLEKTAHHISDADMKELEELQHALEEHKAWDLSHQIEQVITRLNLPAEKEFAQLSGGLKRRVLLGKLLVKNPQLLLLDEPTNHLDIEAIQWLESFLKEFKGTVVFITHDRTFLNNLATRIIELDRGELRSYPGNYTQYQERKAQELEIEATHNKNFDKKLAEEEVWIRQGIKARRTRNEGRVRALEKLREERKARRNVQGTVKMSAQQAETSGKMVMEASNISHDFSSHKLIHDFSTTIMRGDKIGLIGPNGVGKSTLLKILLGELKPNTGEVTHGTRLQIAYFDQLRSQLDENKSVADNVSYGDQYVKFNGEDLHVMSYIQHFLFTPERARTPVKALSGGERNRLLLARLLSKPSNVLVLDEPTNDLDMETLELLEELLVEYEGTVLLVSHDRSFLNNVVTSTIVFEGDGRIQEYVGGYEDWLFQRKSGEPTFNNIPNKSPAPERKSQDYEQKKVLRSLEQKIEKLEAKQKSLEEALTDDSLYTQENAKKLSALQEERNTVIKQLEDLLEEWERLA